MAVIEKPWALTETPDPDEMGFRTLHDQDKLVWTRERGPNAWPIKGETLYKDWFLKEPGRATDALWGNSVVVKTSASDGIVSFLWGLNKTEEQKDNEPFETYTGMGNHYWHGILKRVAFFLDREFPLSTDGPDGSKKYAARMYDRIDYTPPVSEGTLFTHRLFYSATKFNIGQTEVPQPRFVNWSYHGSQGSFQECLGPKLEFPPIQSAFASYSSGGVASDAFGAANGQTYPATDPFEERRSYILSDQQERIEAGWLRHQIEVEPPEPAQDIRR